MTATALASTDVVLTDRAAKRVARILAKEPEGTVLRISVAGGGCSGFQYEYNLVQEKPGSDDIVLNTGDAVVLIDAMRDHEQPRSAPVLLRSLADIVFLANVLAGGATELYGDPVCHVSQRPEPVRERFAELLPDIEREFAALRGVTIDDIRPDPRRP